MSYELVDAEERSRQYYTFEIPDEAERKSLAPGTFAKVIFDDQERMWLQVEGKDEKGRYVGVLKNQPALTEGLKWGDRVTFEPRHVCDLMSPRSQEKNEHYLLAKESLQQAVRLTAEGRFDMAKVACARATAHLECCEKAGYVPEGE